MSAGETFKKYEPTEWPHYSDYVTYGGPHLEMGKRQISVLGEAFRPFLNSLFKNVDSMSVSDLQSLPLSGPIPKMRMYPTNSSDFPGFSRVEKYCGSLQESKQLNSLNIFMPVGFYGPTLATDLVNTARAMYTIVRGLSSEAAFVDRQYAQLLRQMTFQKRAEDIMLEASLSTAQAFSAMTIDAVKGYQDPEKLMADIVDSNILTSLGARLPIGYVAPFANQGFKFDQPVEPHGNKGVLKFTKTMESTLNALKRAWLAQGFSAPGTGQGCPFARDFTFKSGEKEVAESGVNHLAKPFFRVYQLRRYGAQTQALSLAYDYAQQPMFLG